jgi:hypothetical protein
VYGHAPPSPPSPPLPPLAPPPPPLPPCECRPVFRNPLVTRAVSGCGDHGRDGRLWCEVVSAPCATAQEVALTDGTTVILSSCTNASVQYTEKVSCASCTAAGGVWCSEGAWCAPAALSAAELTALGYSGDAQLCPTSASWVSSCSGIATSPIGDDPMYGAQSWVYDLINVRPVWAENYTGDGVQVVVIDDGIDLTLPDFGPFSEGSPKFDEAGSCLGADACSGGGTPFQGAACVAGTQTGGGAFGFHGTSMAAVAVGNADSFCSSGIAPSSRLAGARSPVGGCGEPCRGVRGCRGAHSCRLTPCSPRVLSRHRVLVACLWG